MNIESLKDKIILELKNPDIEKWKIIKLETVNLLSHIGSQIDETAANCAWFLDKIAETRLGFIESFHNIKADKFYDAWCLLERIEIASISLVRNPFFSLGEFRVAEISDAVTRWQMLFPYKYFMSPEFTVGSEKCSICGSRISPWAYCGHISGKVYNGKECSIIVEDVEFLAAALVRNPVQKFSVPFFPTENGTQGDNYDYSLVRFVAERVETAFDGWAANWTFAYHPHDMFADRPKDGGCPCDSGKRYVDCCLSKEGVRRPHLQVQFDKPPRSSLPNAEFAGYGKKSGPAILNMGSPERRNLRE